MQTDNIIEEIRDRLELTQQGKPANTAMNYKMVFQNDPLLKGAIRKNLLTERIDIVKPLGWYRESTTLTDVDIKYLLLYLEENYGLTVEKKIEDAVAVIANENRYHPICDFLNGLEWDGQERIRFCLHRFLGSDADDYTYEALKLFLLGAISRASLKLCSAWWVDREPESHLFSVCLPSMMIGLPMTLKSWTMKMCTAKCRGIG